MLNLQRYRVKKSFKLWSVIRQKYYYSDAPDTITNTDTDSQAPLVPFLTLILILIFRLPWQSPELMEGYLEEGEATA